MKTKQSGFTLIELIVVVALLGILAAVALPRFISVQSQAQLAAVKGIAGGLQSGVALVRAQYEINQLSGVQDNIQGFGQDDVDTNDSGFPTDTAGDNDGTMTAAECVNVWNGILQGGAPVVATDTSGEYQASAAGDTCNYQLNTDNLYDISYDSGTGTVSCLYNAAACS